MTDNHFLIVVTGYNCFDYVTECFASIQDQTYQNFKAVFVDDGSEDQTGPLLQKLRRNAYTYGNIKKYWIQSHGKNMGAAYGRYKAIKEHSESEDDIIVFVGMDDYLQDDCLETINDKFNSSGCIMSYGNWMNTKGELCTVQLEFPPDVHKDRSYRKVKYRSTAPNAFRRFLYDQIPEDDHKLDGEWLDTATESETMLSCLELCGRDRIGIIYSPIYIYREGLETGTLRRLGRDYKYSKYDRICARPKRDLYKPKIEV